MSESNQDDQDGDLPKYTPEMLRQIRKYELGFENMEDFADRIGWSRSTVQRYESGDSAIKPQFIRAFEKLRADIRAERVREENARRIDLDSISLSPGLALLELLPIRRVAGKLYRMFIAVPKDSLSMEDGPPTLSPAPESGASPSGSGVSPGGSGIAPALPGPAQTVPLLLAQGRLPLPEGTVLVENVLSVEVETSESPTRSFSAVTGRVPPSGHDTGQRMAVAQITQAPRTSKARTRFAMGIAMVASLITGCLLSHRPPDEPSAREPVRLPEKYTDNATDGKETNGAMGTARKQSIPMPDQPYSWQKVGPCGQGEREKRGGCWLYVGDPPPCSEAAVEAEGSCFVPIPAKPKKPNTVEPKK